MSDDTGRVTPLHPPEAAPEAHPRASRATVVTAAGVMLLATLAAYAFWFVVLVQVTGLGGEYRTDAAASVLYHGDWWDRVRMLGAMVGAAFLTLVSWTIATGMVDDD